MRLRIKERFPSCLILKPDRTPLDQDLVSDIRFTKKIAEFAELV